jgi:hypothetical protein
MAVGSRQKKNEHGFLLCLLPTSFCFLPTSELAGEVVILDLNGGVYHGLDNTGARIWQLIQTPTKVADVRDAILAEFDVEADRCGRDLLELLEKLANNGLVEVHGPAAR